MRKFAKLMSGSAYCSSCCQCAIQQSFMVSNSREKQQNQLKWWLKHVEATKKRNYNHVVNLTINLPYLGTTFSTCFWRMWLWFSGMQSLQLCGEASKSQSNGSANLVTNKTLFPQVENSSMRKKKTQYLVGGWALPLWKMMEWVTVGMIIPNIWKKKCSKPPTRYVT